MRQFCAAVAASLLAFAATAGEIDDNRYSSRRFAPLTIAAPAGQWIILDREASGGNEFGGPVVDFKSTRAAGSVYPVLMVSAFKRAAEDVTADFLLRTSRDAMQQRGAEPGPVLVRTVNGRKVRFFETRLSPQGRPSILYYVLLEGEGMLFAAQVLSPEADFPAVRKQVDELLAGARY